MIRVIASDMDGTLLGTDHRPTSENIKAIREARRKGIDFVVVTSRSFPGIEDGLKRSGLINGYVLNGGAEVRSGDGGLRESIPMGKKQCIYVGKRILSLPVTLTVSAGEQDFVIRDERALSNVLASEKPVYKMYICAEDRNVLGKIRHSLRDSREISVTSSYMNNLEITDVKAQKGPVLEQYLTGLGYDMEEIMVIGDSLNDHSMFSLDFGLKVAMGNAVPELKRIATYVTKTNDESGAAYAIREMMKRREGEKI